MKKTAKSLVIALLLFAFIPTQLQAGTANNPASISSIQAMDAVKTQVLLARLDEINAMDKSKLSSSEKKQLRREIRSIQQQVVMGPVVFIPIGAIIILTILLIYSISYYY
jgi:hypothetical protein